MTIDIGLLLYPRLAQLDLTGPYEVFARIPDARVHVVWKTRDPVATERGLSILPTATFETCPPLDVVCVPGGPGQNDVMLDDEVLAFLREQGQAARFVTSVCTGALVLGAAGLLRGYRATTHWLSLDLLPLFGAIPVKERVVVDHNRITGGGVTAGIDFALRIVGELYGPAMAQSIQLQIEYNPAPPFDAGTPEAADPKIVTAIRTQTAAFQAKRRATAEQAAARLNVNA